MQFRYETSCSSRENYNEDGYTTENKLMIGPRRPRNHCCLYIKPLKVWFWIYPNGGIYHGKQRIVRCLQRYSWIKKKKKKDNFTVTQ